MESFDPAVVCLLRTVLHQHRLEFLFTHPVIGILMDDVLLELDPDKRAKLTAMLPAYDQLFCTFLPGEPYERYMHDTTKVYKIKQGEWYE